MTIKLDTDGHYTVVITCTLCPFWSAIRLDKAEAHECAIGHEKLYHPGSNQAREAARKWRRRQTATRR